MQAPILYPWGLLTPRVTQRFQGPVPAKEDVTRCVSPGLLSDPVTLPTLCLIGGRSTGIFDKLRFPFPGSSPEGPMGSILADACYPWGNIRFFSGSKPLPSASF